MKAVESIVIPVNRESVFDVLRDPARYVEWVVGTNRFRGVDADWPAPGSRFRHTVGIPPFEVHDATEVRRIDPPSAVELYVMVRPFIEAVVDLRLDDLGFAGTRVTMSEHTVGGLAALAGPLNLPALSIRNRVALRRLARMVTRA
jgi:hypothetical protein